MIIAHCFFVMFLQAAERGDLVGGLQRTLSSSSDMWRELLNSLDPSVAGQPNGVIQNHSGIGHSGEGVRPLHPLMPIIGQPSMEMPSIPLARSLQSSHPIEGGYEVGPAGEGSQYHRQALSALMIQVQFMQSQMSTLQQTLRTVGGESSGAQGDSIAPEDVRSVDLLKKDRTSQSDEDYHPEDDEDSNDAVSSVSERKPLKSRRSNTHKKNEDNVYVVKKSNVSVTETDCTIDRKIKDFRNRLEKMGIEFGSADWKKCMEARRRYQLRESSARGRREVREMLDKDRRKIDAFKARLIAAGLDDTTPPASETELEEK